MISNNFENSSYNANTNNNNSAVLDKTIVFELIKQATIALTTIQQVVSIVYKKENTTNNEIDLSHQLKTVYNLSTDSPAVNQSISINNAKNKNKGTGVGTETVTTATPNNNSEDSSYEKNNKSPSIKNKGNFDDTKKTVCTCIATTKKVNLNNLNKKNGNKNFNSMELNNDDTATLKNKEEVGVDGTPEDRKGINNNYEDNCYSIKSTTNEHKGDNNYKDNYYNKTKSTEILNKKPVCELNKKNITNTVVNKLNNKLDEKKGQSNNLNIKYNNNKKRKCEDQYHYHISKEAYLFCKHCDNYGHVKSKCKDRINHIKQLDKEHHARILNNSINKRRNSDSCIMYNQVECIVDTKEERIVDTEEERIVSTKEERIVDTQVERIVTNTQEGYYQAEQQQQVVLPNPTPLATKCSQGQPTIITSENTPLTTITDDIKTPAEFVDNKNIIKDNTSESSTPTSTTLSETLSAISSLSLSESQKEQEEMFKLFFATTPNKSQQIPNTQVQKKKGGSDNNCDIISEHKEEKKTIIKSGLNTTPSTTTTKEEDENITKEELNIKIKKNIITGEDEGKSKIISSGLKSTTTTTSTTTTEPISNKLNSNKPEVKEAIKEETTTSGLNQALSSTTVVENSIYKNEEDLPNNNYTSEEDLSDHEDITWPGINMTTEQAEAITENIETLFPDEYRTKRWLYKTYLELKLIARDTPTNNNHTINRDLAERLQLLFEMGSLRC